MPETIRWAVVQLLSYYFGWWVVFVAIAAGAAYLGRWRGIVAGHFAVALLVSYLDIVYQSQHTTVMDMDIVFEIGVLGRILLINTVLLSLSAMGLFMASRRKPIQSAV